MQCCFLEMTGSASMLSAGPPNLGAMANLEADDLLGTFSVLREEHLSSKARGGRGVVVVVLTYQGAGLAVACRLDEGTI